MFKEENKRALSTAGVFISLILGAGFASGQELTTFFVRWGSRGALGLVIACAIMGVCGWAVMDITVRLKINGYSEFMTVLLGRRLGTAMVFIVNIFIFVMLSTMFSGFAAGFQESVGINFTAGVIIIAGLCFVAFLFDLQGIVKVSVFLAPILVVCGIFFGLYSILTGYTPAFLPFDKLRRSFVWPALIYASYNLLTAVSVLSSMGAEVGGRKTAKKAGLLSGAVISVLGLCFLVPMLMNAAAIEGASMPMLVLAHSYGSFVEIIYMIVLFAAIFTTALSSGFAVIEWLSRLKLIQRLGLTKLTVKVLVTAGGAMLAHVGFATFIEKAYPLFGYIGLFEIAVILIYFAAGRKKA